MYQLANNLILVIGNSTNKMTNEMIKSFSEFFDDSNTYLVEVQYKTVFNNEYDSYKKVFKYNILTKPKEVRPVIQLTTVIINNHDNSDDNTVFENLIRFNIRSKRSNEDSPNIYKFKDIISSRELENSGELDDKMVITFLPEADSVISDDYKIKFLAVNPVFPHFSVKIVRRPSQHTMFFEVPKDGTFNDILYNIDTTYKLSDKRYLVKLQRPGTSPDTSMLNAPVFCDGLNTDDDHKVGYIEYVGNRLVVVRLSPGTGRSPEEQSDFHYKAFSLSKTVFLGISSHIDENNNLEESAYIYHDRKTDKEIRESTEIEIMQELYQLQDYAKELSEHISKCISKMEELRNGKK